MDRKIIIFPQKMIIPTVFIILILGLFWAETRYVNAYQQRTKNLSNPPPSMIAYQGYITEDGIPFTGTGYFKFAVVESVTGDGTTNDWSNDGTTVGEPSNSVILDVDRGLFNILLGDISLAGMDEVIDAEAFNMTDTYLRVWFSATGDQFQSLEPNTRFASVAYALRARVADSGPEETDPIFYESPANTISNTQITHWDEAYNWGDHATAGYLTSIGDVKQLVHNFVVASGESVSAGDVVSFMDGYVQTGVSIETEITYGDQTVFNNHDTRDLDVIALNSEKFVVAFRDDDSGDGVAMIGQVSGTTVTYSSAYTFSTSEIYQPSLAALTEEKFVLVYWDYGNGSHGESLVGEVSGTTITFGSEVEFNPAGTYFTSVAKLSDSTIVVAYADCGNNWHGTGVIGTVSGTNIAFGSEYIYNPGMTDQISVASLSTTKFVVAYLDWDNSEYGSAVVGVVFGDEITFGSEFEFNYASSFYIDVTGLTDTKFAIVHSADYYSTGYGNVIIGDVSDRNISYGSDYTFTTGYTTFNSAAKLSDSVMVLVSFMYSYSDELPYGIAVIGKIIGNTVSCGPAYVYNAGPSDWSSVAAISNNKFVVAYWDYENHQYGTAIIGEVSTLGHIVGIARESQSSGGILPVIISGVSDLHSDLIPGDLYYSTATGTLTSFETPWPVGLAISETELLMDINLYPR